MTDNDESIVFRAILDTGCCKRCGLRFINDNYMTTAQLTDLFENPTSTVDTLLEPSFMLDDQLEITKKRKSNHCCVCLGLLEDTFLDEVCSNRRLKDLEQYDDDTYSCSLQTPSCLNIRERSMVIFLKEKFPQFYEKHKIVPLTRAWRWSVQKRFDRILKKTYDYRAKLTITIVSTYNLNEDEVQLNENKSRKNVCRFLGTLDVDSFKQRFQVPPTIPIYGVELENIHFKSLPLVVAGNYCKYSRFLYQRPGVFDGNVTSNRHSVQSIITDAIAKILKHEGDMQFGAGGNEKYNVRVLGNGRPFYVYINNPIFKTLTPEQCKEIEEEIEKSSIVSVNNLQLIKKVQIQSILNGELASKTYSICIRLEHPKLIDEQISRINQLKNLMITQKTPSYKTNVRYFLKKTKIVHYMKATYSDKPDCLSIEIHAEAGLYIPEFVDGDAGGTEPCLQYLLNDNCIFEGMDIIFICSNLPKITEK